MQPEKVVRLEPRWYQAYTRFDREYTKGVGTELRSEVWMPRALEGEEASLQQILSFL
jgi:hypothetical protein